MADPTCHYCGNPAEAQCPTCGRLYCPDHGEDVCLRCLAPESAVPATMAFRGALLTLVIGSIVTAFLVLRPPESETRADTPRIVATSTPSFANTATPTPPRTAGPTTIVRTPLPSPSPSPEASPTIATPETYTVQAGDTLGAIAQRFGITLAALEAANPGVNANTLGIGAVLIIPKP